MMSQKVREPKVRVLNFSDIDLPFDQVLKADSESSATLVDNIRRYADLPFVYVVAKNRVPQVREVLAALRATRSPCYPYAIFCLDGAQVDPEGAHVDVERIDGASAAAIHSRISAYAAARFCPDDIALKIGSDGRLPQKIDVAIIGAGITGIYAANRLREAGISFCVLEKRDRVGGIWSMYANSTSQVNSSECGYRLFDKDARSNRDHSFTWEILEDIRQLSGKVEDHLFLETEVDQVEKRDGGYRLRLNRAGQTHTLESTGVIVAINDRVGAPRKVQWNHQENFKGTIVSGFSDETRDVDWRGKNVVIAGMGAFAIENTRTALEAGARHVTVVARRHGTICPKIIDYLNFSTPYDDDFRHDKKSNMRNMMYWKKLYDLSGATQPECWMGKIKHDGHTISVSDIWFIGHYLKKISTITGEIDHLTADGVMVDGQQAIDADIVVNCIGFERGAHLVEALSGYREMYCNNYIDRDFMYLADAYIDGDAFNSLFGSSVLEMVKFYMEVFILFYNSPDYDPMMNTGDIYKIPVTDRKWSHYIEGAKKMIRHDPRIRDIAWRQVRQRTENFLMAHDLETYISQNKREWLDMHAMLAGRPMEEEACLPYVFEKLAPRVV